MQREDKIKNVLFILPLFVEMDFDFRFSNKKLTIKLIHEFGEAGRGKGAPFPRPASGGGAGGGKLPPP